MRIVRKDLSTGQGGFSLIEVLVTLVIVSMGTLGMAGMQAVSMKSNTFALQETQAATLAQDMVERIRANPEGDYTSGFGEVPGAQGEPVPICHGVAAVCDAAAMAQFDLLDWKCTLGAAAGSELCEGITSQGQLPDGDASISVVDNIYTIVISWTDATSDTPRTVTFSTAL